MVSYIITYPPSVSVEYSILGMLWGIGRGNTLSTVSLQNCLTAGISLNIGRDAQTVSAVIPEAKRKCAYMTKFNRGLTSSLTHIRKSVTLKTCGMQPRPISAAAMMQNTPSPTSPTIFEGRIAFCICSTVNWPEGVRGRRNSLRYKCCYKSSTHFE